MPTIDVDNETDRWQWTCPRGHTTWEAWNGHFFCNGCSNERAYKADVDPEWRRLKNKKTEELVHRSEIELQSDRGNWRTPGSA